MKYQFFSLGYRCSSAGILKQLQLKHESYPFDWIVSRLPVIQHCLETNFQYFIEDISQNYSLPTTTTTKHYDLHDPANSLHICDEKVVYNTFYLKYPALAPHHTSTPNQIQHGDTYSYPLLMNHHNPHDEKDASYFRRCIFRLYEKLTTKPPSPYEGNMYLYIHPALYPDELETHQSNLKQEILDFQQFLQYQYPRTYPKGLCFIPVKTNCPYPITQRYPNGIEEIHNSFNEKGEDIPQCIICLVYMNKDFIDAGEIFMRNAYIETEQIIQFISKFT